jgi:hypothetical protein
VELQESTQHSRRLYADQSKEIGSTGVPQVLEELLPKYYYGNQYIILPLWITDYSTTGPWLGISLIRNI